MNFSGYDLVEANTQAPYACLFYDEHQAHRYAMVLETEDPECTTKVAARKIRVDGHTWNVWVVIQIWG